ncbi:hypothetical protein V9T40_012757 [Parthenolecanium corni]|uniref:Uncharacterized protein n=1 Tax=Parthenolecanium corni TaxID=536013 RepID=A0AAN9TNS2_9HEMI
MSVEEQQVQTKQESQNANIRVSPLPAAVSPTSSLPAEELPGSNSPVLTTMTPVSVDDFPAEYQHHEVHDENMLNAKQQQQQQQQVIYVSAQAPHQTILYDPQNPDSLGQQISIQETINTSNGPVSVVVPSSLAGNGSCQGPGTTVLVYQEYVEDVTSALPLK